MDRRRALAASSGSCFSTGRFMDTWIFFLFVAIAAVLPLSARGMLDPQTEIYCAEQIHIPPTFPNILKRYAKAAIRTQPCDLLRWTAAYFRALANGEVPPVKERLEYPPFTHPTGITPGYLKILLNRYGYVDKIWLRDLLQDWHGLDIPETSLYQLLMVAGLSADEEFCNFYRFLAIACGFLGNNLRETMIYVCELLTREPEGGSAMIPLRMFLNLYGYLADLDCSGYVPPSEVEEYAEEESISELSSRTIDLKSYNCEFAAREKEITIISEDVCEERPRDEQPTGDLERQKEREDERPPDVPVTGRSVASDKTGIEMKPSDPQGGKSESIEIETNEEEKEPSNPAVIDHPGHGDEGLSGRDDDASEFNFDDMEEALYEYEEEVSTVSTELEPSLEKPSCRCLEPEIQPPPDPLKEFWRKMREEVEAGRLDVVCRVPGIGPPVSVDRVTAVGLWLTDCARRQEDVTASVEVHFENKDGGFFLKHTTRQYYPARTPDPVLSTGTSNNSPPGAVPSPPPGSILSIDKFTVFQTSEPVSVRATYGPFSTKQTVPARYIVPDPLDALPAPETRRNLTAATILDAQELGARHLDMSAHLVGNSVPRDSPVLRVLFHAGSEAGTRRQLMARHQRVCVVLHASLVNPSRNNAASRSNNGRGYSSSSSSSSSFSSASSSSSSSSSSSFSTLTAACSPDGENGVCLAQITIPPDWWAPLPPPDGSGRIKVAKSLPRMIQVAYSVLEPRSEEGALGGGAADGESGFCRPRVQIQPVTPLGQIPLVPNRAQYKELKADDSLTLLVPHEPLYPRSRLHVPAFLYPIKVTGQMRPPLIVTVYLRARVKSGVKILDASSSSPDWTVNCEVNAKNTAATFTARRKENASRVPSTSAEEIMTILLEACEEEEIRRSWDGGRIVWSVRFELEGDEENGPQLTEADQSQQHRAQQRQAQTRYHHRVERRKLQTRLEIQKDDIQAVLPISKNWEVMNTAVLTGHQVSQGMKVFIVSQSGAVADVTLQSSCHSEDESVLKVSSSCSSVYVDGSEIRGSSNASVLVKYGTYTGLARFTVWMPEFPLEVTVDDTRLSQIKGWKVSEEHAASAKSKRSLLNVTKEERMMSFSTELPSTVTARAKKRSAVDLEESIEDTSLDVDDPDVILEEDEQEERSFRNGNDHGWDTANTIDRNLSPANCRLRFQQSPIEVHARFLANDHDTGRESYFVNRRTWLRVTDLVASMLRVSDPRIATLLQGRLVQGRGIGRTEVQVLSPLTGRVIGAKEVRVGNDRVSVTRLSVRVVSGLQLNISPDTTIENGYVAETSVTRRLTAQYQEGLLDIDVEFSDGTRTPLREIAVTDYHLLVESLDQDVVAFAPMVASHHPRVIAIGEGRGDLLRVSLQLDESCRLAGRRSGKGSQRTAVAVLATATASVEVDFASSDVPNRPEFVQNDGGGTVGSHHHRERKTSRGEVASDLHDILIGLPLKDEKGGHEHEPLVQARQHRTAIANGMSSGGMGVVGVRHHGVGARMSPLEIGMYVLLAAFCFAIVVFVVSCVVYASKFKPQPPDSPLTGAAVPVLSGAGARARAAANQLASGKRPPRESTTNAHDWVWLGRATLERAACGPQQVRVTSNPLAGEAEPEAELGTCFDNPNHIELPSVNQRSNAGGTSAIDTTTYCKKDRIARNSFPVKSAVKPSAVITPTTSTTATTSMVTPVMITTRNDNDDIPPPLPPHGVSTAISTSANAGTSMTSNTNNGNNEDYKPPVPPHRNTGVNARLPEPPRKHRHRASSGGSGSHHGNNHRHGSKPPQQSNHNVVKPHGKTRVDNVKQNGEDEEFVELVNNHQDNRHHAKDAGRSREIKRATIVGNPMFSSFSTSAIVSTVNSSTTPTGGTASSTTTSPPSSSPSASSSSSASSTASSSSQEQEESVALDDLNLGMDYNQIMQYFDNLKESNA